MAVFISTWQRPFGANVSSRQNVHTGACMSCKRLLWWIYSRWGHLFIMCPSLLQPLSCLLTPWISLKVYSEGSCFKEAHLPKVRGTVSAFRAIGSGVPAWGQEEGFPTSQGSSPFWVFWVSSLGQKPLAPESLSMPSPDLSTGIGVCGGECGGGQKSQGRQ